MFAQLMPDHQNMESKTDRAEGRSSPFYRNRDTSQPSSERPTGQLTDNEEGPRAEGTREPADPTDTLAFCSSAHATLSRKAGSQTESQQSGNCRCHPKRLLRPPRVNRESVAGAKRKTRSFAEIGP